jgi:hypothetical protein
LGGSGKGVPLPYRLIAAQSGVFELQGSCNDKDEEKMLNQVQHDVNRYVRVYNIRYRIYCFPKIHRDCRAARLKQAYNNKNQAFHGMSSEV